MDEEKKAKQEGHRSRVLRRYEENGLDSFREDYEVLELLLFYAVPRKDTKDLAKDLISRFGSLHAVFDASPEQLTEAGVTQRTADLLTMIPQLGRRYEVSKEKAESTVIRSTADAGRVMCAQFRFRTEESVRLFCLSASGKIIRDLELAKGDVNAVHFPIRKIVETAINAKAVSVILAHNHPGGTLAPSREDIDATIATRSALDTIGVRLLDHIIVSGERYCSLREEGVL